MDVVVREERWGAPQKYRPQVLWLIPAVVSCVDCIERCPDVALIIHCFDCIIAESKIMRNLHISQAMTQNIITTLFIHYVLL
jgi:heterodisulfide reductase subunit C